MALEFHPLANIFPLMSGEAWTNFLNDVQNNGLQDPIVVFEGKIVDGRNRYNACVELGEPGRYVEWVDPGCGLKAWIISKNISRRHLNPSQLGLLAVKLEEFFKDGARRRKYEGAVKGAAAANATKATGADDATKEDHQQVVKRKGTAQTALRDAAAAVGVGGTTAERAKRVVEQAPDLIPKIEAGEMTVASADAEVSRRNTSKSYAEQVGAVNATERNRTNVETVEDTTLQNVWLGINSQFKRMRSKEFGVARAFYNARVLKDQELDDMITFLCDVRSYRDGDKGIVIDVQAESSNA